MGLKKAVRASSMVKLLAGARKSVLLLVFVLSVVGSGAESLLLVVIVRVGTAAVGGTASTTSNLDALTFLPQSLGQQIIAGLVLGVIALVFQVTAIVLVSLEGARIAAARRRLLLHDFFATSLAGRSALSPGALQELASQGVNRAADGFMIVATMGTSVINLAVLVATAFVISPIASVLLVAVGAFIALLFIPMSRIILRANRRWLAHNATFASFVAVFSRMGVEARVFSVVPRIEDETDAQIGSIARAWRRSRIAQRSSPIVFRIVVLMVAFAVLGLVLLADPSSVGAVAVIALLMVRALSYIQALQASAQSVHEYAISLDALTEQLSAFPPDDVVWGSTRLAEIRSLQLTGVRFSHDGVHDHLDDVHLECRRGELITITGASGAGKSTLLRVLLRLVQPTDGQMLVNDRDASALRKDDWFDRMAYLPQEVRLIPGTLADNVRFFRDADDDAVREAIAKAALVLDETAFPDGISGAVHEDGANLSGGQRQRIGLARALLRRPDLLVLDEPTTGLDPQTERDVVNTIRGLKSDTITVLVTHQPAVAQIADRSYRVHAGSVTEQKVRSGV